MPFAPASPIRDGQHPADPANPGTLDVFPGRPRMVIHPSPSVGDSGGGSVRDLVDEVRTRIASALAPAAVDGWTPSPSSGHAISMPRRR